jgi:hypothetical protein
MEAQRTRLRLHRAAPVDPLLPTWAFAVWPHRQRARTDRGGARKAEAAARAKAAKTLPLGHHAGAVDAYASLPLLAGESVLQV